MRHRIAMLSNWFFRRPGCAGYAGAGLTAGSRVAASTISAASQATLAILRIQ